jgi:hypothetical protein
MLSPASMTPLLEATLALLTYETWLSTNMIDQDSNSSLKIISKDAPNAKKLSL